MLPGAQRGRGADGAGLSGPEPEGGSRGGDGAAEYGEDWSGDSGGAGGIGGEREAEPGGGEEAMTEAEMIERLVELVRQRRMEEAAELARRLLAPR